MMSITWFDMIPILGAVITVASIGLKAGRILQKLEHVIEAVEKLDKRMITLEGRFISLENRATVLETLVKIGKS